MTFLEHLHLQGKIHIHSTAIREIALDTMRIYCCRIKNGLCALEGEKKKIPRLSLKLFCQYQSCPLLVALLIALFLHGTRHLELWTSPVECTEL